MKRETEQENKKPEAETAPQPEQKPAAAPEKEKQKPEEKKPEPQDKAAEAALHAELEETKKQLQAAQDALAKQKDALLRTAAEYDNYRKRTAREKEAIYSDATADAVREILSVQDNLERALEQKECTVEDLRKGVEMTGKQMDAALKKLGVAEMDAEGKSFDPQLHNAVAHVEDEKLGENVVVKVFQKGYTINGKVIRHAIVQTAN